MFSNVGIFKSVGGLCQTCHVSKSMFLQQLRLLSDDPERISRQLAEGAHKSALPAQG